MRIAFDLDGTLVDRRFPMDRMKKSMWHLLSKDEYLRLGIREIADYLKEREIELWVYTSSFRSPRYIKSLFKKYGISLDGIINQEIHHKATKNGLYATKPSKYPPYWDIDILVEDQSGIKMEGEQYGFKVILLNPEDDLWHISLREEIERLVSEDR